MQGYSEILTAFGAMIPGLLFIAVPVTRKRQRAEVVVLTPALRERVLQKRALRRAMEPSQFPAA